MTMWAHLSFSQRATWPPSAAVRQCSIALMTFIWPRLTWPALALRHAAPWSRKISATSSAGRDMAPLRRRLVFPALLFGFLGLLAGLRQKVERAFDAGDHAGSDARIARRGVQFVVTQERLDDSDISAALQQVGREAVAQRVQRHALLDPGFIGRLVEQSAQLAGGHRLAQPAARKQPALLKGRCVIETPAHLPPLPQQIDRLRRQHDIAILAALGLLDANDPLRAVDMLDLQPDHLAGAQAAAIAETEQHAGLEARGDGQQAPRLVRAHHQRDLLGLAEVIDLGGEIPSAARWIRRSVRPAPISPGSNAIMVPPPRTMPNSAGRPCGASRSPTPGSASSCAQPTLAWRSSSSSAATLPSASKSETSTSGPWSSSPPNEST